MYGNSVFTFAKERGWRGGLSNLMRAEFNRWFKTRLWWSQALLWSLVIGGILLPILQSTDISGISEPPLMFSLFAGLFTTIAAVIIMQDALVGEKETGTAAWVLSKPASRPAFFLSKLLPNMLGTLISMLIIPGLVFMIELQVLKGRMLDLGDFLAGIGVLWVNLTFYLALTHMLGAFFRGRAPVIGIGMALAFGQQMLFGILPALQKYLPWTLAVPGNGSESSIAGSIMLGQVPADLTPLVSTCLLIVIFISVGLWRFNQEEF